ncbi:heavy metal translocating P-type ATPase [Fictibacillus phosphorivorans]|uniref:heavy metal translocating P-type ATPase n=1 Tax=Fictibacillus phosphorivorans TaxID=1221500 RepID=UPI00203D905D|nr:heavy metal translocating P-type ATPase [Fictibacillus phosphorivorans]MCM3719296.1 heavy metal translocating P-type ATPase [Fictibacillus phosphorivorans]MCM3776918.1 heavy metal translocating P-type ATPase [Fictibacillus phosphorivorans]
MELSARTQLILATTAGCLILSAWLIETYTQSPFYVLFYILAFIVGGYAKAVEGIQDSINEKKLNVELLMMFAAIGSAAIGYWGEGAVLILIFAYSGALESYTLQKSDKEIKSLISLQPEEAWLISENQEIRVDASTLKPGNRIKVKPGERIPADGVVQKGKSFVNESALTGESFAKEIKCSSEVLAGTLNQTGLLEISVTKHMKDSVFQRMIDMVNRAQNEAPPVQRKIEEFEAKYVLFVLLAAALTVLIPGSTGLWSYSDSFYRACVLLVVASPCALVASTMPALLASLSNAAKQGILFKSGVFLEKLRTVNVVAFDKTGTLTEGNPSVTAVRYVHPSIKEDILNPIIYTIEKNSTHPLAKAILKRLEPDFEGNEKEVISYENIPGLGVKAEAAGIKWKIGSRELTGISEEKESNLIADLTEDSEVTGQTIVYVTADDELAAYFLIGDTVRCETIEAIDSLKKKHILTLMLTGDSKRGAEMLGRLAKVDEVGYSCMPEDKVNTVKGWKDREAVVAMIGDGVNDAPALAIADVGVAMGMGSDAAIETADVVLVKNDLSKLLYAMRLSERLSKIVKQNIVFSIGVILFLLLANFFQVLTLPLGVIGHEGSTILVILNGLRLMKG